MSKIIKQKKDFNNRCNEYIAANKKLLEKFGLKGRMAIHFPFRRRVPFLCRLAVSYLISKGGTLDIRFEDKLK